MSKKDGKSVNNPCVVDGSTVYAVISKQMTVFEGRQMVAISITNNSDVELKAFPFVLNVIRAPSDAESYASEDEHLAFETTYKQVLEAKTAAENAAEAAAYSAAAASGSATAASSSAGAAQSSASNAAASANKSQTNAGTAESRPEPRKTRRTPPNRRKTTLRPARAPPRPRHRPPARPRGCTGHCCRERGIHKGRERRLFYGRAPLSRPVYRGNEKRARRSE